MRLLKNTQSKLIGEEESYSLEEILDTAALELALLEDELEAVA